MSAPPIRIESKAWTDLRFHALAYALGLPSPNFALIQVATIWRWQTEHYTDSAPTYVVAKAVVIGALGPQGPSALVEAELAEPQPDGRLRIKGGVDDKGRSRIDWLFRDRERQRGRGEARARQAEKDGRAGGRYQPRTSRTPAADQPDLWAEPAASQPATSSPDSGLCSTSDLSVSPADPSTGTRDVLASAIVLLNEHRGRLKPKAEPIRSLTIHIGPASPEGKALETIARIPEGDRYRLLARAIEVLVFRVESGERDFGDLRIGYLFGPSSFDELVAAWPPTAKARAGPPGRSRGSGAQGGGAIGRAPPAADHSSTDPIDPKDI